MKLTRPSLLWYLNFSNTLGKIDFHFLFLKDFLITMVMAVFWLSGSAAWASGVSAVKYVSDPSVWIKTLEICKDNICNSDFTGNFAGLNISIVRSN